MIIPQSMPKSWSSETPASRRAFALPFRKRSQSHGPVADNGRTFEQMNLYEAIKKRIETIVSLPAFTDEFYSRLDSLAV
jgi:hypothetical protein